MRMDSSAAGRDRITRSPNGPGSISYTGSNYDAARQANIEVRTDTDGG
jgi:hypothetical protein